MSQQTFAGLRVVDFGWVWAGTVLGHILADHGAEVIKMESKKHLDGLRLGKVFELGETLEVNPWFHNLNRNKLSFTVDITNPRGLGLVRELIAKSDIVIENFNAGVMERHGLGYGALCQLKSDIIMISLAPVGQHGPISDLLAYAPIISALSGIDSMVGYPGETPLGFKHAYGDPTSSLFGEFALLCALRYRKRMGKGQYIDLAESECVTSMVAETILDYQMNGRVRGPMGNNSDIMAPHGNYPCRGDDAWVSIGVKTEAEWQAFRKAIGNPAWTRSAKFADRYSRLTNTAELDRKVSAWTSRHEAYEAAQILQKAGVAAAPVLAISEIFVDPHINARHTFAGVDHPMVGGTVVYDLPWKIQGVRRKPLRHAPLLGEHNQFVLHDILGRGQAEIEKLVADEVVY